MAYHPDPIRPAVMLQFPPTADSTPSPSFRWNEIVSWEQAGMVAARVVLILILSWLVYRGVRLLVKRLVSYEVETEDPIVKRVREQRAQTLGGLLNNIALIVIVTLAGLTILNSFIQIGPLLAGVGVVGLAISFGAQSLVKDVISGTFILLEGQFGIGDVVRIGDTAGLVEKITLRTTMLRDAEGIFHIIPNGEITRVSNMTKNWSRSLIDVSVSYRNDVDTVIRLLQEIGMEFERDEEWHPLILEPFEVLGLNEFTESGIVVRMQVKTLPLKQWVVSRELRRRIKYRFEADGIEMAWPHVRLYWGEGQMPLPEAQQTPTLAPAPGESRGTAPGGAPRGIARGRASRSSAPGDAP